MNNVHSTIPPTTAHENVVRGLANDPNGWSSPTNRMMGHIARSLLADRVDPEVIYRAIEAGYQVSADLP